MKKLIFLSALFAAVNVLAQNSYDPLRLVDNDLTGTARFVGMGGAMSALGTDISVMSSNPAGIGLYRANDASFTLGLNIVENEANGVKSDHSTVSLDNFGIVLASEADMGSVKFVNVAAAYRRRNSFANRLELAGSLIGGDGYHYSQQYQLYNMYENGGDYAEYLDYRDYTDFAYPWLGLMTSTSGLLGDDGNLYYVPDNENNTGALYPTMMEYLSKEKGGVNDVDINISCNVDDKLYLGLTVGASYVDYTRYAEYSEFDGKNNNYYTLQNNYNVSGTGINLKVGAILRPFEYSPLKLGVAIHTPTWYSLTDRTSATMIGADGSVFDTRDYDYGYGSDLYVDYDYTTPWRFNLSASYTFDKYVAVDAEYEYVDYSTAKLKYTDGGEMQLLNDEIEANMKAQHIFKVGALFNIDENISFCCGFNHITAPFRNDAVKSTLLFTDTAVDFTNRYEMNIITLGAGYRGEKFYFDAAYKLAMQKADFYNYYDSEYYNPCTAVSTNRSSLLFSLGYRF